MISFFTESVLLLILGLAAVCDLRFRRVPDRYAMLVMLLAVARWMEVFRESGAGRLLLFCAGGVLSLLLFAVPAFRGKGMGGADVKLATGIGFFYGASRSLVFFCGAFFLCLFHCFGRFAARQKIQITSDGVPLVPFFFWMQVLYFVSAALSAA